MTEKIHKSCKATDQNRLRILIIDDEECVRDSLAIYLYDLGHDVYVAEKPSTCDIFNSGRCTKEHPCADLLLIDHNMPEVHGLDFLYQQSLSTCKLLPKNQVVMSGTVTPEMEDKAAAIGCLIVQKPFSFAHLDRILDEIMERHSPQRVLAELPEELKFSF